MILSACGGGGSGGAAQPTPDKQAASPPAIVLPVTAVSAVFDGYITDTGQPLVSLLQADGSYYLVYLDNSLAQMPAGVIFGTGTLSNGSYNSSNGMDVSLIGVGGQSPAPAVLQASLTQNASFNGTLTYQAPKLPSAFSGTFNSTYSQLPTFSALAGVYTGAIATPFVKEDKLEITISDQGAISGKLRCGCSVSAMLVPRADGTAYMAGLSFVGGDHPLSNKSMGGNVYFDTVKKRLYIVGKLGETNEQAIFVGSKP